MLRWVEQKRGVLEHKGSAVRKLSGGDLTNDNENGLSEGGARRKDELLQQIQVTRETAYQ